VYRLWARVIAGEDLRDFTYTPRYHVCHAARRTGRQYRYDHAEVVKRLGDALLVHTQMPAVYHSALGEEMYLVRHRELPAMQEALRLIQTLA
jgi:hypothetical protein